MSEPTTEAGLDALREALLRLLEATAQIHTGTDPNGRWRGEWRVLVEAEQHAHAAIENEARASQPLTLDVERLATIVSDSLAATTEGTDWAEAPEPSDEPGSPYVLRLTNEIASRLSRP